PPHPYPLPLHDALPIPRRSPNCSAEGRYPVMLFPRGAKGLNRSMKQYAQIIPIDAQFAADFVAILLFKKYNAKKVPLFRRQLLRSEEHTSELQSLTNLV